jgi:hypothetical protein
MEKCPIDLLNPEVESNVLLKTKHEKLNQKLTKLSERLVRLNVLLDALNLTLAMLVPRKNKFLRPFLLGLAVVNLLCQCVTITFLIVHLISRNDRFQ